MRLFLSLLFGSMFVLGATAQSAPSKASERLQQFVEAFNTKDKAKIAAMVEARFAKAMFASRKQSEWVDQTFQLATDLAPIKVAETLLDKDNKVVIAFTNKGGARMGLTIFTEKSEPFGIAGILISPNPESLVGPPKKQTYAYETLQNLADTIVKEEKVPAIVIATWRDGKIESTVSGVRKVGAPDLATTQDRWLIGSIGKSMTATMIGTLIEEKMLSWDSKLGDLLKDIPMNPAYREVTIEQLMTHRSGIQQDQHFDGDTVNKIVGGKTDPTEIRANYAKDLLAREPLSKPGEKFAYSNAGYALLGHIAERITKTPYETLMMDRVFKPIGMTSAICGMPGADGMPGSKGQPSGHFLLKDGPRAGKLTGTITYLGAPAGLGVACSIEDLAKYAAWHMSGFLGERVPGMTTATFQRLHTAFGAKPGEQGYAAGWILENGMHEHNGSDGTFISEIAFWPKEKLVAVAISNVGGEAEPSPARQAIQSIYKKLFGPN